MINPQRVLDKILEEKGNLQEELKTLPKGTGRQEIVLRRVRIHELLSFIEKVLKG